MSPRGNSSAHFLAVAYAAASIASIASPTMAQEATYEFEVSSPYWCNHQRINGKGSGKPCVAPYVADTNACDKFAQLEADDAGMQQTLEEVRNSEVCIGETVDQAKANSIRLRADMMGYVSLGNDESVNDPTASPQSDGIIERAKNGGAPYWPLVSYYLYQCVVEVCESK